MNVLETYYHHLANVQGDMWEYLPLLRTLARGRCVLEVGVRDGASTSAFLSGYPLQLDSVDREERCGQIFSDPPPTWNFIHGDSHSGLPVGFYDVVLVDGDHSREGVRDDLERYGARLRHYGGILLAHDVQVTVPRPVGAGDDWPGPEVGEEFGSYCSRRNFRHFTLPGRYGLGLAVAT